MKGNIDNFKQIIAKELGLGEREVGNTLALLNDGCTIPFISRYRKERTGSMDEMHCRYSRHERKAHGNGQKKGDND